VPQDRELEDMHCIQHVTPADPSEAVQEALAVRVKSDPHAAGSPWADIDEAEEDDAEAGAARARLVAAR
jgi:hypothetical protein